jgi:hypothetical protein
LTPNRCIHSSTDGSHCSTSSRSETKRGVGFLAARQGIARRGVADGAEDGQALLAVRALIGAGLPRHFEGPGTGVRLLFVQDAPAILRAGDRRLPGEHFLAGDVPLLVAGSCVGGSERAALGVRSCGEDGERAGGRAARQVEVDRPRGVRSSSGGHRLFRDWLRAHPGDRELYASAKRRLARETADKPGDYSLAKNGVIDEIYARIFHEERGIK